MELGTSLTYYDKILLAIVASLGGGALTGVVTNVRFQVGLLAGALVATVFVYDATFRRPPRPVSTPKTKTAALVWLVVLVSLVVTTVL